MATQHRGNRHPVTVRIPISQYALYESRAKEQGITVSDYITSEMAAKHALDEPAYIAQERRKVHERREARLREKGEQLPLSA